MSFANLLLFLATCLAQGGDESEPDGLLRRAEEKAARGQYKQAVDDYARLAKRFPGTSAGRIGLERAKPTAFLGWGELLVHGSSSNRIEVPLMGDGFPLADQKLYDQRAKLLPGIFERYAVFEEYLTYFNFLRINLASRDSNFDRGQRYYETALDGHDSGVAALDDGFVTVDRANVKQHLDNLSGHDGLAIALVRRGHEGVSRRDVAVVVDVDESVVHEWGHVFGELADEHDAFTGHPVFAEAPNLSLDPDPLRVPWKRWIGEDEPGIGVYEGANGFLTGAWRPTNECAMGRGSDFCPVCREALVLRIYRTVDPIEFCRPDPHSLPEPVRNALVADDDLAFQVVVLAPASHGLDVRWWVLPRGEAPAAPSPRLPERRVDPDLLLALHGAREVQDRRRRGPLEPIGREPVAETRGATRATQRFELKPQRFEPGIYRVVCRVEDSTQPRGAKRPWVRYDPHGVLVSERAWWVLIP